MRFLPQRITIKGNPLLEQLINDILAQLRAQRIRGSSTMKVNESANGTTLLPKLGGGGSSAPSPMRTLHFKQSLGDYFLTNEGIAVAKDYKLRCSITSQTIYSVLFLFTYPHNPAGGGPSSDPLAYLYRVAATPTVSNTVPENEGIVPQFLVNDPILCCQPSDGTNGTGGNIMSDPRDLATSIGGTPVPVTWMMLPCSRAWSRFNNQSV